MWWQKDYKKEFANKFEMRATTTNVCSLAALIIMILSFISWLYLTFDITDELRGSIPFMQQPPESGFLKLTGNLLVDKLHALQGKKDFTKIRFSLQPVIGSAEWFARQEEIYAERNRRIKEVCQAYSDWYESPQPEKKFWLDTKNHLALCMHAKVKNSPSD